MEPKTDVLNNFSNRNFAANENFCNNLSRPIPFEELYNPINIGNKIQFRISTLSLSQKKMYTSNLDLYSSLMVRFRQKFIIALKIARGLRSFN